MALLPAASAVLEKPEEHNGVEALQWMAPKAIAEVLEEEHPQIAATVMTQLYDEQAAKVLELLSEELRNDVILRIARMEELDPQAMEELDRVLESQLGKLQRTPPRKVMGPDNLAAILNATGSELEQQALEALSAADEDLSFDVKEKMFIFDNLMQLEERALDSGTSPHPLPPPHVPLAHAHRRAVQPDGHRRRRSWRAAQWHARAPRDRVGEVAVFGRALEVGIAAAARPLRAPRCIPCSAR